MSSTKPASAQTNQAFSSAPAVKWFVCALAGTPEIGQSNNQAVLDHVRRVVERQIGTSNLSWRSLCGAAINATAVTSLLQEGVAQVRASTPTNPRGLLIYYGGHGNQVADRDGDEDDGLDEYWSLQGGGMILDDTLTDILADLPASSTCVVVSDSCSSGTMIDARRWKGKQKARWASFSACRDNQDALVCSDGGVFTTWGFLGALEALVRPTPTQICTFIDKNLQLGTQSFRYDGNLDVNKILFN
jgi:hypothetical protein